MPPFVRRFRVTAGVVAASIVTLTAAVIVAFAIVVPRDDAGGDLILAGVVLALVALGAVGAVGSVRRARALRRVTSRHPAGLVFLARRQPAIVSDLADYLYTHEIYEDVADRWVVALVDDRGISAWSIAPAPAELLLMPWDELGTIQVTDLESGARGRGIEIDVRPAQSPLVAALGYAAFGLTALLNRAGAAEVAAGVNALRPGSQAASSGSDG